MIFNELRFRIARIIYPATHELSLFVKDLRGELLLHIDLPWVIRGTLGQYPNPPVQITGTMFVEDKE